MKLLTLVLLGMLSFLMTGPIFAAQGDATGQVRVTAEVIDINYLKMTSIQEMRMPSMYTGGQTGYTDITSDSNTDVVGGKDGQNAKFSITGRANIYYAVALVNSGAGVLNNANGFGAQIPITYEVVAEGNIEDGTRFLDSNGNDILTIQGTVSVPTTQEAGSYNNFTSPMQVTISYDGDM